jgi:hypothetical protein
VDSFQGVRLAAACTRNGWEDRVASFPCEVQVFPLLVKTQLNKWPEYGQRKVRWFPVREATAVVGEDDLRTPFQRALACASLGLIRAGLFFICET